MPWTTVLADSMRNDLLAEVVSPLPCKNMG